MNCIRYAEGYRYQLRRPYVDVIEIRPVCPIKTEYIDLDTDGSLTIRAGYAWDGPSGPAIDTPSFMRGSLVHDACYQLLRENHLDHSHRATADKILRRMCEEDGMWGLRRWWVYHGVRIFANPAADPANISPDQFAPKGCCD